MSVLSIKRTCLQQILPDVDTVLSHDSRTSPQKAESAPLFASKQPFALLRSVEKIVLIGGDFLPLGR